MKMKSVAREACSLLRGIVCIYKPPDCSTKYLITKLTQNICNDLNALDTGTSDKSFRKEPHLGKEPMIGFEEHLTSDQTSTEISESVKPNYAANVLCRGPRYRSNNVTINFPKEISDLASGVLIATVNGDDTFIRLLKKLNFTRCYQLKGLLGQATKNFHISERVLTKAKYDHVNKEKFELVLASHQSAAQKRAFEDYGKPLQTQEAYYFATKGLQRPYWNGPPVLYSIKLVDFDPPDFTIEVQCANETQEYLLNLVNNVGVSLKCFATCSGIRCIRQGCFHVEHALARPQWNLAEILSNINLCWKVLKKNYPKEVKYLPVVKVSGPSEEKFIKTSYMQHCDTSKDKSELVS